MQRRRNRRGNTANRKRFVIRSPSQAQRRRLSRKSRKAHPRSNGRNRKFRIAMRAKPSTTTVEKTARSSGSRIAGRNSRRGLNVRGLPIVRMVAIVNPARNARTTWSVRTTQNVLPPPKTR
jgi:hypothetical protein